MTPNANSPLIDFNGDGKSDILWRNSKAGENQVWFMDGAALLSSAPLPAQPDLNWHLAVVADVNRDAKPDLVWRNYQTGGNLGWVMNGAQFVSTIQLPTVADSFWALSGAADFNGDGQTDFLWRNYRTGEIQIWLMNGANLASTVALKTIADTKWTIEGTADLNGNGRPDILWRNFWTGENAFWLMDGTTLVSDSDLPKLEDPNWRMTGNPYLSADGKPGIVFRNYHTGKNLVWFLDWNGGQPKIATELSLPDATDTAWQIVDPYGYRVDSILSDQEGSILAMEATTLSAGGWVQRLRCFGRLVPLHQERQVCTQLSPTRVDQPHFSVQKSRIRKGCHRQKATAAGPNSDGGRADHDRSGNRPAGAFYRFRGKGVCLLRRHLALMDRRCYGGESKVEPWRGGVAVKLM